MIPGVGQRSQRNRVFTMSVECESGQFKSGELGAMAVGMKENSWNTKNLKGAIPTSKCVQDRSDNV